MKFGITFHTIFLAILVVTIASCSSDGSDSAVEPTFERPSGKADSFATTRQFEVILTDPHCDVCTPADKDYLLENSRIIARVIELIDGAQESIEVAQFTFSRRNIEAALLRAHERGIDVKLAMNSSQKDGDTVASRLAAAGVDVKFVEGKDVGDWSGLQHAKYMLVDETTLLMGSNNWSSTGTSLNEENTVVLRSDREDPMLQAFGCYFDVMRASALDSAQQCATEEVAFTPGFAAFSFIRDQIRAAEESIDVLMHHLLFDDAVKVLAQAAERGVRVRVVVNAADREETQGNRWDRLRNAGGQIRYKRTNGDLYQLMHHKLAVIDDRVLLNGSGNWSGSAFFNNYEFYVRHDQPEVVRPFENLFDRLWDWSLTEESLDAARTPAEQDFLERQHYFGNLHAHYHLLDGEKWLDDGTLEREENGETIDVTEEAGADPARYAFEYARDSGNLDFMALTPHVQDEDPTDQPNVANMNPAGYAALLSTASSINQESNGQFVAIPGMEWSTNSTGNHVNIVGTTELCKVVRGDYQTFFEGYLVERTEAGERPMVQYNHPRTFRTYDSLNGSWDQIFGVNLAEIPNDSDREKKFNDFGIDDYPPLENVLDSWISGESMPDEAVVEETHRSIQKVADPYIRLMEVTVGRGTSIAGTDSVNPSLGEDSETGEVERFHKAYTNWDYYLLNGYQLAPTANHDNHRANWGSGHSSRTVVLAEELTEDALLDAIDQRAVYASEDENLRISLYAEQRIRQGSSLTTLGDRIQLDILLEDPDFDGPFEVKIRVGTVGTDEVTVQQDVEIDGGEWTPVTVALPDLGQHFVYLEVFEPEPNRMAWSAPIFVDRR